MKITKKTVKKWLHVYENNKNVSRKDGSGRHRKTTFEQDQEIIDEIKKNKLLTAQDIKKKLDDKQIVISTATLINRFHESGFLYKKPKIKPLITEIHREKRLSWAQKHIDSDLTKVGYSDETSICIGLCGKKRWTNTRENDTEKCVKHPLKIHVWGYIAKGIRRIHIFEGIMNARKYIEILTTSFLDIFYKNPEILFQDDNDPKHRSKIVTEWKDEYGIKSLEWRSYSPDMNPIENIWGIVKNKIARIQINTKAELIKCIETEWNNIDDATINNLIDSMPTRVNELIKNEGNATKY